MKLWWWPCMWWAPKGPRKTPKAWWNPSPWPGIISQPMRPVMSTWPRLRWHTSHNTLPPNLTLPKACSGLVCGWEQWGRGPQAWQRPDLALWSPPYHTLCKPSSRMWGCSLVPVGSKCVHGCVGPPWLPKNPSAFKKIVPWVSTTVLGALALSIGVRETTTHFLLPSCKSAQGKHGAYACAHIIVQLGQVDPQWTSHHQAIPCLHWPQLEQMA